MIIGKVFLGISFAGQSFLLWSYKTGNEKNGLYGEVSNIFQLFGLTRSDENKGKVSYFYHE